MKRILLSLLIFSMSLSAWAISPEAKVLKDKLAAFDQVHAEFVQVVTSREGAELNESAGEVSILRPGKFHWQVISPEEELIVSDGKTIWYYSPFIEQVTLIKFSDAIEGTAFALLAGADDKQWADYVVTQKDNIFMVSNSDPQAAKNTIIFEFNKSNNISKFMVIEELGQRSEFVLTHKALEKPLSDALFDFEIPAGVEVDDQR